MRHYDPELDKALDRIRVDHLRHRLRGTPSTVTCEECGASFRGTLEWLARWAELHECELEAEG